MIIVTGATGKLGQLIVEKLLEQVSPDQVGVSVRDPAKAHAIAEKGVRVRRGDFMDPTSLATAFEGATQVLIISSNANDGTTLQQHRNAIDAAKASGARRILYTSHAGLNLAESLFPPLRNHAATEGLLQESGIAFTSLRNGQYASTIPFLMGQASKTGEIIGPADGPVAWTAHDDLAQVAAIALTSEGTLDGITPPLTAAAALDLTDIAPIASELMGRPIKRLTLPDEQYRDMLISFGTPQAFLPIFTGLFAASHAGEFSAVDPTLEQLLGRPPMSVRDVLATLLKK